MTENSCSEIWVVRPRQGICVEKKCTQDYILGNSQPFPNGTDRLLILPRTASWATLSRPCGAVTLRPEDWFRLVLALSPDSTRDPKLIGQV